MHRAGAAVIHTLPVRRMKGESPISRRRLFIAIEIPKPVCWRLSRLVVAPPRGVRPVGPAQMHLTLHFLGDVEDDGRASLIESLGRVGGEPFTLGIRGVGVFPVGGRPSVLWAGVAASEPLTALHAAIGAAIAACGLDVEARPYLPHVTLARLTPAVPKAWVAELLVTSAGLTIDELPVDRFHLYESRRLDGTTEHAVRATFQLSSG